MLFGGVFNGAVAALNGRNFMTGSVKPAPVPATMPAANMPELKTQKPQIDENAFASKPAPLRETMQNINNEKTIIGETMSRVEAVAAENPGSVILNDMPKFTGSPHQVTSQMMRYNRQWILEQIRSGRTILDIGADPARKIPSVFYQMEQQMLKNYQKIHQGTITIIKP
jgi:hypothetical protein